MFGRKSISDKIICCIIAVAVIFSGMCVVLMKSNSLEKYDCDSELTATIEAICIEVPLIDMATSDTTGICNSTYIQQIVYQNTVIKKISEFLYHAVDSRDLIKSSFSSFIEKYSVEDSLQFTQGLVVNYIHSMDGKKRI